MTGNMVQWQQINKFIVNLQKVFLFCLMSILSLGMLAQIITRYIFNSSFFGLEQFIGYSAVWLYFIGAAYGSYERSHIKAEFINILIKSQRQQQGIRAFAALVSSVMAAIFTKWSWQFCAESIAIGETTPSYGVPMIYFQAALLVGGVLMTLYFSIEAIDHLCQLLKKDKG